MIAIIAAISNNQAIGKNGTLPWHLPNDLKRFKQLTLNQTVIMGRHTFASIGKPLPNRHNIVVTQQTKLHPDVLCVPNLSQALQCRADGTHAFIIGGERLYQEALALADTLYLTFVDTTIDKADAFFPPWNQHDWQQTSAEKHPQDDQHCPNYTFATFSRAAKNNNK
jgi:dihydrofolate reductase